MASQTMNNENEMNGQHLDVQPNSYDPNLEVNVSQNTVHNGGGNETTAMALSFDCSRSYNRLTVGARE